MDRETFLAHIVRVSQRLYAWAMQKTRNADEADDLYQDVVARAWEHLSRSHEPATFEDATSFDAWLFTLAHHLATDRYRQQSRATVVQEPKEGTFAELVVAPEEGEPVRLEDIRRIVADLIHRLTVVGASDTTTRRLADYLRVGMEVGFDTEEWARRLNLEPDSLRAEKSKFLRWCRSNGVSRADYIVLLIGLSALSVCGRAFGAENSKTAISGEITLFFREVLERIKSLLPVFFKNYSSKLGYNTKRSGKLFTVLAVEDYVALDKRDPFGDVNRINSIRLVLRFFLSHTAAEIQTNSPDYSSRNLIQSGLMAFLDFVFSMRQSPNTAYLEFVKAWTAFRNSPVPQMEIVLADSQNIEIEIYTLLEVIPEYPRIKEGHYH